MGVCFNSNEVYYVADWECLHFALEVLAPLSLAVDKYVTPVWCLVGVIGNAVSC